MPELPEVECVRRTLTPRVLGRVVARVRVFRRDVAVADRAGRSARATDRDLLLGARLVDLRRHGKQLALVAEDGRILVVQLGMSGRLVWRDRWRRDADQVHSHVAWDLRAASAAPTQTPAAKTDVRPPAGPSGGWLVFNDARRFGGLWAGRDRAALDGRWNALGPDALECPLGDLARALAQGLARTRRAVKPALLDQAVIAGVGNIYADEALFLAGIDPRREGRHLRPNEVATLARSVRQVLARSVESGGATLRDYVDGDGAQGRTQRHLAAYGRAGEPCLHCGGPLTGFVLAQRATVACPRCQPAHPNPLPVEPAPAAASDPL